MTTATVRSGASDLWTLCQNNSIKPNNVGSFDVWVSKSSYIKIYDSSLPAGARDSRFLLISPDLSNKYLQRLTTLLRKNRLTCGFSLHEARNYREVFIIDPNKSFSGPELEPLRLDDIKVKRVPGQEPQELLINLEKLIA